MSDNEAEQAVGSKDKKGTIDWTPRKEAGLVAAVQKHKVFIDKVGGETKQKKWNDVVITLLKHHRFAELSDSSKELINQANLTKKLNRMKSKVEVKGALKQEGSNLSGLEEPTDVEKGLLSIIQSEEESKVAKKQSKDKVAKRNSLMLSHESDVKALSDRFHKNARTDPSGSTLSESTSGSSPTTSGEPSVPTPSSAPQPNTPNPGLSLKPPSFLDQYFEEKRKERELRAATLEQDGVQINALKSDMKKLESTQNKILSVLETLSERIGNNNTSNA